MTELDGRFLALLLVAGADPLPLDIVHQRQVEHTREGTFAEFDWGAGIHHRYIVKEEIAVVRGVVAHQLTSTA
jgi:hypothetical protein